MNLLLRLIVVLVAAVRRSRLGLLDESVVTFRAWPNDLDINGHMNNGRYLSLMDLGRVDLVARIGLLGVAARRRWRPIVASAIVRFRRSLTPFSSYQLRTRVVCWDEKWVFVEHRFERHGTLVAVGFIKGLMRARSGNVPTADVLRTLGITSSSPEMPAAIRLWQEAEAAIDVPAGPAHLLDRKRRAVEVRDSPAGGAL